MVELTSLPLVLCSECIENINISGAMRITNKSTNQYRTNSLIDRYVNRSVEQNDWSLYQYIHEENKKKGKATQVIPHFVGMTSTPTYPPTVSYARATLIIHAPWREAIYHKISDAECLERFYLHIERKLFPTSVILTYKKVKMQHSENRHTLEPVQANEQYEADDMTIPKEEEEIIRALSSITSNMSRVIKIRGNEYNRGLKYDWSSRIYPVSFLS